MKETNRVSNIELLRIVAMFMVLLFHANMWSLECCYNEVGLLNDFNANIQSLFNINLESGITCICVNLFVIISGFFGIKLNLKKIKAFVFQCVFIGFVAFLLYWILNPCMKFSGGVICQILVSGLANWFVRMYLLLMFASPALNMYIKSLETNNLIKVTLLLLILSSVLGFNGLYFNNFASGYSFDFFIVLYFVGACLYRYRSEIKNKIKKSHILIFYLTSLSVLVIWALYKNKSGCYFNYDYNNPLILMMSIAVFSLFIKMNFTSKIVNVVAQGCFAVFLLHTNDLLGSYFKRVIQYLYVNIASDLLFIMLVMFFLTSIYLFALLIDFFRRKVYKKLILQ